MSFAPDVLRRQAARTLGQMHRGICILQGRDADVLYSVVHDMATRNALSEAFQKRLDEVHALPLRRFAGLRDANALQGVWVRALEEDAMPGALWALLTHPLGAALEQKALFDARAWVFLQGRRGMALARAAHQADDRIQEAQLQLAELRARLLAQQQHSEQALIQARAETARLRGDVARLTGLRSQTSAPEVVSRSTTAADPVPAQATQNSRPTAPGSPPPPGPARGPSDTQPRAPDAQPIPVHGRRVLCVGGIQHAVARYRGRIEKLGGHFEHHDGGLEDSVQALEGRLRRADLVICQAACINHEAYHRIKRHCERTGTPCMYLDRPSLSRLDRALAQPRSRAHAGRAAAPTSSRPG